MNEETPPEHVTRFVEAMIEVAAEFAQMMNHMHRHVTNSPDAPPPPVIARNLVSGTLGPELAHREREVETATELLRRARTHMAEEIVLVEPGTFPDFMDDDFEPDLTEPDARRFPLNGRPASTDERLH